MFGELSRRNIMALGASAGGGLGLGSISTSALAKAAKLRVQAPYWYRFACRWSAAILRATS